MIRRCLFAPIACALLAAPASAAGDGITLGKLTAQLYYKNSGTLSKDVLGRRPAFSFWNTGAGTYAFETAGDEKAGKFVITDGLAEIS